MEIFNKKSVSFDIFDTVITRETANPKAVFFVLQNEVTRIDIQIPAELSQNLAQERISAERQARKATKTEDIRIHDIYNIIADKYNLSIETVEQLIATEMKVESDVIRVIPETAQLISDLRKQGKRIIYISDMYLPTEIIRNILIENGLFCEGDGLYVSGHVGLRKKTGRLFKNVLRLEGLHPSQIIHVGDHRRNDYLMARLNGIEALYLKRGRLNHYEKILADCQEGDPGWLTCQLLGGAGRLARLEAYRQPDARLRTLHEIGANVAGPVLFLFVFWLLHEAKKDNIKTLYFLARDGQIMMQIAAIIAEKLDFSIELKYLYVSRQSLFAPSFLELSETDIEWILNKDPILNIALVAKRLSLDESIFRDRLVTAGFPRINLIGDLPPLLCLQLKQLLLNDVNLRSYIAAESQKARGNVLGYLCQEGLCESRSWALVDSGWNGRLQSAIETILTDAGFAAQTHGYYFGFFSQHNLRGLKKGFLFSPQQKKLLKWCRPFTFLYETMSAAPHGTTLAYEKLSLGDYRPVLDNSQNGVDSDDIISMREGAFDYVKALELGRINYDEILFRDKAFCLLRKLYLTPSKSEAEAFGKLKYSNDQTDSSRFELAPAMSFPDCCKFAVKMLRKTKYAQTYWLNGSRARSSHYVKPLLYVLESIHFNLNSMYVKYLDMKSRRKL